METPMSEVTLYGFPRSVYVQMAGSVLTHHEVAYAFHDLETEMNTPAHLALHPFERVPILRHGDFTLYETGAIVGYVDEVFGSCRLTPGDPRLRGRMNQWISAVNGYYYPYLIYHVSHERNVFPQLGIASDEAVVAHAVPKVEVCLQVLERELSCGGQFSARTSAEPHGFLHIADYPRLWLRARGASDVSEFSSDLRLARTDGKLADNEALSRRPAAARTDRTCAAMGGVAPPEVLKAGTVSLAFRGG
jgi:glutathione S-transferase